ncbi:glycerophosphodiester phosphodiesterase (plasmid) [Pedobacter sp. BS3]|uniref:glycerophosphodiester phosphodiesterase n=1 Tax=Pedobacter sp. BS3 TaxID=2567937 RepID=UPI0011EF4A2E|nr:glycerophosphodiester phosphodiesterase [Pedobacter sp. BS3]TZF86222.1 glycerophosphodiester phosphodiesterase [Pedobacter sp. BS3]
MKANQFIFGALVTGACLSGCSTSKKLTAANTPEFPKFDYEAHRGGRGLMPENTIPAMKHAIDLNVTTLELDMNITKDKKVVVSHDPYFNPDITTTPEGKHLTMSEARKRLLYSMTYDSIRKYDVGIKPDPHFPQRKNVAVVKPLLADLIDEAEAYAATKGRKMFYDMEIKSSKAGDNIRHPEPEEFVNLVFKVLKDKKVLDRTVIQSFDIRPLQIIHKRYPEVKLSYLVGKKTAADVNKRMEELGFNPYIYSVQYDAITPEMVKACHDRNIKIIAWTPNTEQDFKALTDMGVDGIITDYPNLYHLSK